MSEHISVETVAQELQRKSKEYEDTRERQMKISNAIYNELKKIIPELDNLKVSYLKLELSDTATVTLKFPVTVFDSITHVEETFSLVERR